MPAKPKGPPKVRVRMYRQGLGDCFLVSFFTGPKPVHMLIDCGTLGATTTKVKMADVVKDISKTTSNHLHVLVATHEHKDHVSGFGGDPSRFAEFKVDRAWVAWTEDPKDQFARNITKHKGDLRLAVALTADALGFNATADPAERDAVSEVRSGIEKLLSFVADLPAEGQPLAATLAKGVDIGMRYVTERAGDGGRFLEPGDVIEGKWLPGVRFYVLGPPRSESALRNMGDHGSPELYSLAAQLSSDLAACCQFSLAETPLKEYRDSLDPVARQRFEQRLPFDPRFRLESADPEVCEGRFSNYYREEDAWRQIDSDWLGGGSDLALQLDTYTNNTSLVLAIELIDDGRVLLFPADAQVGNWLSWHEPEFTVKDATGNDRKVNVADLLARTVFYKVGHHSSHNATVKEGGLELMQREDLVAMIPVDRKVAMSRKPPWQMPANALYKRLIKKTKGRVIRSDSGWPEDKQRPNEISKAEWNDARKRSGVTVSGLYVDYELR
ncbi:MAG: hypothetical protein ABR543_03805 [Gemmatimonadaceae bacterium]